MSHSKEESRISLCPRSLSRRRFLSALGAASAGILAGACSKEGPTEPEELKIIDPAPPESADVAVAEIKIYDRNALKQKIGDMIDRLGGLGDLVKSGDKVGLKVNFTGGPYSADNWKRETGVDGSESYFTHPLIMNAVGELCIDAGAGKLYFIESWSDDKITTYYGYDSVVRRLNADWVNTDKTAPYDSFAKRSVQGTPLIYDHLYQNKIYTEIDCFISLPKVKQHISAGVTVGMKNLVGTLPQPRYSANGSSNRWAIHSHTAQHDKNANSNLGRVIIDINRTSRIHLTVADAIKTTVGGEGPWCSTMRNKTFNRLIVGKDVVATDTISTQIMGFNPNADDYTDTFALPSTPCINYMREAERLGLGVNDLSKITTIEV